MALVSGLSPLPVAETGHMEFTIVTISSLTGLQEIENGWVLANGVLLPAGAKYDPLRSLVGTNYGPLGTLPTLIDGVQPAGKGATTYTALGIADGAIAVTLGASQISNHTHTYSNMTIRVDTGSSGAGFADFSDPNGDGGDDSFIYSTGSAGGGGSHNNMPPYVVVEGIRIKL